MTEGGDSTELPTLSDGVVHLRGPDERDLDCIAAGIVDPEVVRWLGPLPGSAEDVLALNRVRAAGGSPTFTICERDGDRCVGFAWLNRNDEDPKTGSIGYWLLPGARGRGLATRAVKLVVGWAGESGGVRRLRLVTATGNHRSRAVAARAGFQQAELRPRTITNGQDEELVVYVREAPAATD
jgi:RimJ/RimL family protein N-acetyltransferase